MIVFKTVELLQNYISKQKKESKKIGFVPTMGALHAGHISLIETSKQKNLLTVCSIFVNPTQFNDPKDFENYPITIEADILLLEENNCDVLFLPSMNEIYPSHLSTQQYQLGFLETILEGKYRPGHFQGVCQVVDRLLQIVNPHFLFLGQKDFQQCKVIELLIQLQQIPTHLIICETQRELNGLAMSSRNKRLQATEIEKATNIYKALNIVKQKIEEQPLSTLKEEAIEFLLNNGFEKVDYIDVCDATTLTSISAYEKNKPTVIVVAAFLNGIRLIDNILLS